MKRGRMKRGRMKSGRMKSGCMKSGRVKSGRVKSGCMKSLLLSLILSLSFCVSAFAADGKAVAYKSCEQTASAIVYTPVGKGPFAALIVVHEWWELNDWVKQQAEKLAGQGYVALAVDLYRGKVADNPDLFHEARVRC